MDTISSAVMLWLGLTAILPKTTYEIDHFYTYDKNHKQQPLVLQKKVFIPEANNVQKALVRLKGGPVGIAAVPNAMVRNTDRPILRLDKMKEPHMLGWVAHVSNNGTAIDLMTNLAGKNITYYPVVKWEGMDCIPTKTLILQTKPFVTEKLLRKRLSESAKVKIGNLENQGNQWSIEIAETSVPNMLVLANLISEDTAWVEWCRVHFVPLYAAMTGSMTVTTPAVLNLGYDRQLDVVITVYKPSVKIRKDMLPKLGQNQFVPTPQKDDVWYDIGQTTITEEKSLEKTVIKMTTPFRVLNYGKISIPQIQVAYEEGKAQGTFVVPGTDYTTQSVITDTDIDDIQAMPTLPPIATPPEVERFKRIILPWRMAGIGAAGVGLGLLLLICAITGVKTINKATAGRAVRLANEKLWQDLRYAAVLSESKLKNWQFIYKDVNNKLAKVLSEFYDIKVPISSDSSGISEELRNILRELEKLYKADSKPDLKRLAHDVNLFVTLRHV